MPYLILNPDNSILEVTPDNGGGGVLATDNEMSQIAASKFGHSMFDYVGGELVHRQDRHDAFQLQLDKQEIINDIVSAEIVLIAKERLTPIITTIKAVSSRAALEALR